jgi:outer membrane murein-binding lipoprotein Lpp
MPTQVPPPASPNSSAIRNKLLIAGAILLFLLVFGELWRRISQAAELRSLERQIGAQVTQLAGQSNSMATQIGGAQSDAAVANWARDEGKLVLPGEVLVQPLAPTGEAVTPAPAANPTGEVPNWRVWWEWLWGES